MAALRTAATAALIIGLLAVTVPAAQAAPAARAAGAIAGSADGAVDDSYLVLLDDGPRAAGVTAQRLADDYGVAVTRTFSQVADGFTVTADEADAAALAADPAVRLVARNQRYEAASAQPAPENWGLDRIDQPALPLDRVHYSTDGGGEGVTVYLLDTGIRYSHQAFGGRAVPGYDFFGGDGSDDSANGHGTHVAAIAGGARFGVARAADLVSVKVLGATGSGTTESILAGLDWVLSNARGPSVVNLSIKPQQAERDPVLDEAVRAAIAAGLTFTVAAGDLRVRSTEDGLAQGTNVDFVSPARVPEAITVASSTVNDLRSRTSNHGPGVDLFAPGSGIVSAGNASDTATAVLSGTSMAAAHVAGAAALHLSARPADSPAQVAAALTASATTGRLGNLENSPDRLLRLPATPDAAVDPGPNQPPTARVAPGYTWYSCMTIWFNNCAFDARGATDPDGTVVAWVWEFGDRTVTTDDGMVDIDYRYGYQGGTLTVIDNGGATASVEFTADVIPAAPAPDSR